MAKSGVKILISYKDLLANLSKDSLPNNIMLNIREKVLCDEIIKTAAENFLGKNFEKNNLIFFNSGDIENALIESQSSGLFSERKVVVVKNVNKLLKDSRMGLINYLGRFNPDVCLIITNNDEQPDTDKLFLLDSKDDGVDKSSIKKIIEKNLEIYELRSFSESETTEWVRKQFEDYEISVDTINHFLSFSNYSFDEILSEIEKLKTFTFKTKKITNDDVNLCNGISKEFNELDFIEAVIDGKNEMALRIYEHISLKKDVEVYLIFLLSSAFVAISKLRDEAVRSIQEFKLKYDLKMWYDDKMKLLQHYKKFAKSTEESKLNSVLELLYSADKTLKSSGIDKNVVMVSLINNICAK